MDTREGTLDNGIRYHYDLGNDVLYLRLASLRDREAFREETPDGFILLRDSDDAVVGMTVVDYWRRFGVGALQDVPRKFLSDSLATRAQSLTYALAV